MAQSNKLNELKIKKIKPGETETWHRDGDGLSLRVYPQGAKVWYYVYTNADGRKRYQRLGEYPAINLSEARNLRDESRKIVRQGVDPLQKIQHEKDEYEKAETVSDLVKEYLDKYAKLKKGSWEEDERILNKDVIPVWGDRKAKEITRRDVLNLLFAMDSRGKAITLNTYKIIRKMFKFAVANEIVVKSPCDGLTQEDNIPTVPSRERILDIDEIKTLWDGLGKASMSDATKRALKLILVTCQRPGEVAAMHRSEIRDRWWEFTPKATKITKDTPRQHRVYLTDTALELIGDQEGYIFPSPDDGEHVKVRSIAYAIRRNLKDYKRRRPARTPSDSDIPKMVRVKEDRKLSLPHFTPHDLRRTGATFISSLGFSDEIIDAVLAHLKKGVIKIYNRHGYDEEKKRALIEWEKKLLSLISPPLGPIYKIKDGKSVRIFRKRKEE